MLRFISRFPIVGVLAGLALLAWGFYQGSVVPEVAGGVVTVVSGFRMVSATSGKGK